MNLGEKNAHSSLLGALDYDIREKIVHVTRYELSSGSSALLVVPPPVEDYAGKPVEDYDARAEDLFWHNGTTLDVTFNCVPPVERFVAVDTGRMRSG